MVAGGGRAWLGPALYIPQEARSALGHELFWHLSSHLFCPYTYVHAHVHTTHTHSHTCALTCAMPQGVSHGGKRGTWGQGLELPSQLCEVGPVLSLLSYSRGSIMQHLPQGLVLRGHHIFFCVTLSFLFKFPNYIIYKYAHSHIPFF